MSQTKPSGLNTLAAEKAEISKLDWILMVARVRSLEYKMAHNLSQPASEVGIRYDRQHGKVIVAGFVDLEWLDRAKLDDLKKRLTAEALEYCVDGLTMAAFDQGFLAGVRATESLKSDCVVQFFTWELGQRGVERKDIAKYQNGQLILE